MTKLRVLDLFSGIGGFSLGLERTGGFETVAFCEIEDYPRRVLAKHWPDVPIHNDVRELTHETLQASIHDADANRERPHRTEKHVNRNGEPVDGKVSLSGQVREILARPSHPTGGDPHGGGRGAGDCGDITIDLICGGYPCQPFSHAGKRQGAEDDRHLWPEVKRLVASIRPRWCLFENVAGHISMGLDEVLSDLEGEGYTAWPVVIPACAVDAPHRRDRVWIVAHAGCEGIHKRRVAGDAEIEGRQQGGMVCDGLSQRQSREGEVVADTNGNGIQGREEQGSNGKDRQKPTDKQSERLCCDGGGGARGEAEWLPEPDVGRVAHGIPKRVDKLKGLGNAVVPQIPEMIGYAILEAEESRGRPAGSRYGVYD